MNILLQVATAITILWCVVPLVWALGLHLLLKHKKASRLSVAAVVGFGFFLIFPLFILAGMAPNTPSAWGFSAAVGIVFFVFWLVRESILLAIMQAFKGYKTYDEYLQGRMKRADLWAEAWKQRAGGWKQRPLPQRLKEWALRMWRGEYP